MSPFNQIHVMNTDAFNDAYNPKVIHQSLARRWMVAMEKRIPDTMPAVVPNENSPIFKGAVETMKQIVTQTAVTENIHQMADIYVHLATLFMIKHWKYRQPFAYAVGCSGRYHDVVQEEAAQPVANHHNVAVEQQIIHEALTHQK